MIVGKPVNLDTQDSNSTPVLVEEKDVTFIDYDGTVLYSYTKSEFAQLTTLPKNPAHEGLVSQGWNWTLTGARSYAASYGNLVIGQIYNTDDGKTRIHIRLTKGRTSPYLGIAVDGTVEVDWGDNTAVESVSGTSISDSGVADIISTRHNYAEPGDYVISIHVVDGCFAIKGTAGYPTLLWKNETNNTGENGCYGDAVTAIHVGDNCVFGAMACYKMRALTAITFPAGFSLSNVTSAFYQCYALRHIVIPNQCDVPDTCFCYCSALFRISMPENGAIGKEAFRECRSLQSINLPANLAELKTKTFSACTALFHVTVPNTLRTLGTEAFSTTSIEEINLPIGITVLPSQVFKMCMDLTCVIIPSTVTNIADQCFYGCAGLKKLVFLPYDPPTVANTNAWYNLPEDCVIYTKTGRLNTYVNTDKYPSSSTYSYKIWNG